jgi:hypothetical protein
LEDGEVKTDVSGNEYGILSLSSARPLLTLIRFSKERNTPTENPRAQETTPQDDEIESGK